MAETVLVELYAGMAALSLWFFDTRPILGRQGSKSSYARAVANQIGLASRPTRFVLNEADSGVATALACLNRPDRREAVAAAIDQYASDGRRDYLLLRDLIKTHHADPAIETARWLAACAGSAYRSVDNGPSISPSRVPLPQDGRSRTFSPALSVLAARVRAFPLDASFCTVRHGPAETLDPIPGAFAYLDPPYAGTAGYAARPLIPPRVIAKRWARAGCRVALSETDPAQAPLGWRCVDLTRAPGTRQDRQMIRLKKRRELLFLSP